MKANLLIKQVVRKTISLKLLQITISTCLFFHGYGQPETTNCFADYAHEIRLENTEDYIDLNFLKIQVIDKRIVLLGENSHTVGDYYKLKTRLMRFLHEECGYDVFAVESGIADVYTICNQSESITAEELMDKTLFANMSCNEMLPLFDYMQNEQKNTLHYCGFDSQNHGASLELIQKLLTDHYGNTSDSLVADLHKYYQSSQLAWLPDKAPITALADTVISSANHLLKLFQSMYPHFIEQKILTETHYKILERSLINHREAMNLNWYTDNPLEKRDSMMADNLLYLANEIFPNKKIIVWAHNTHIDKGGSDVIPKNMGYYLHQKLKNSTFHIGLYARSGELFWWWTKDIRTLDNNQPNDIENLANIYPITYVDIAGNPNDCDLFEQTLMGYEVECGRKVALVPSKRYDAIINFRKVSAATYPE